MELLLSNEQENIRNKIIINSCDLEFYLDSIISLHYCHNDEDIIFDFWDRILANLSLKNKIDIFKKIKFPNECENFQKDICKFLNDFRILRNIAAHQLYLSDGTNKILNNQTLLNLFSNYPNSYDEKISKIRDMLKFLFKYKFKESKK